MKKRNTYGSVYFSFQYLCISDGDLSVEVGLRYRMRQWLCAKHQRPGIGTRAYPDEYLYETLGLVRLEQTTRNFPWAKA